MLFNRITTLRALAALAVPVWMALPTSVSALNPIHESSYSVLPRGKYSSPFTLQTGTYFFAESSPSFDVPLTVTLSGSDKLEIGVGLKTRWVDVEDNVPFMVFGAKLALDRSTSVHIDMLLHTNDRAQRGLTLGLHQLFASGGQFYSRLTGKVGMLDALVRDDALMAMEAAWYPTLRLMSPLSVELGVIASSQTFEFENNLAIDLQPGLIVHIGGESVVETMVTLGLAGDFKEDLRVKMGIVKGF